MNAPAPSQPALADRLKSVRVGLRDDLNTTRHLFAGEVAYILSDPLTFQSHRLNLTDYSILVQLDPSRALGDIFSELLERRVMTSDQEESFYEFVFSLHRLGFLTLPVSDDKRLYHRFQLRQQAKRKRWLTDLLFLQIPLWNPDLFLEKTIRLARPMFSRTFVMIWAVVTCGAAWVIFSRWQEFHQPLSGLLTSRNLPWLWVTLIGLKVYHEFGHAYACKFYGLHVPEMGLYLVAGTPCAYVDATASWSVSRRRRIVVALAGMYFESMIAALAVFVWAMTGPSLLNSLAYNVVILAGAITVLFNINPLMRYDGYYILSDLLEIPNLRQRSTEYTLALARRALLGVGDVRSPKRLSMRAALLSFGIAAPLYRVLVMVGIAAIIASKMFVAGLLLGVAFFGSFIIGAARRAIRYLWYAGETAPVRARAVALSAALLVGLPLLVGLAPVGTGVYAPVLVVPENETVIRAKHGGFIKVVGIEPGQEVGLGQMVVELENDDLSLAVFEAQYRLEDAQIRHRSGRADDLALAQEAKTNADTYRKQLLHRQAELSSLRILSQVDARVVSAVRPSDVGRFVPAGETIAVLASGGWRAQALLSEYQMSAAQPALGDRIEFRSAQSPRRPLRGFITHIEPANEQHLEPSPLTFDGGGDIVVDPQTGQTRAPVFRVTATLEGDLSGTLRSGMSGRIRMEADSETIALHLYRRLKRFADAVRRN